MFAHHKARTQAGIYISIAIRTHKEKFRLLPLSLLQMCRVCYSERVQVTWSQVWSSFVLDKMHETTLLQNKVGDGYETYVAD